MTGIVAALAVIVASWNPALFAERSPGVSSARRQAWLVGSGVVLAIAAVTGPILDVLDVSVPTFRTAAGAVIALVGARWLIGPPPRPGDGNQRAHGAMDVATPEIVVATMTTTASDGWPSALLGVVVAATLTVALVTTAASGRWVTWLRRLLGGVALVLGVALIYAGIRSV